MLWLGICFVWHMYNTSTHTGTATTRLVSYAYSFYWNIFYVVDDYENSKLRAPADWPEKCRSPIAISSPCSLSSCANHENFKLGSAFWAPDPKKSSLAVYNIRCIGVCYYRGRMCRDRTISAKGWIRCHMQQYRVRRGRGGTQAQDAGSISGRV